MFFSDFQGSNAQMVLAEHDQISMLDLESMKMDPFDIKGLVNVVAVDVHLEKEVLFWTDVVLQGIYMYVKYLKLETLTKIQGNTKSFRKKLIYHRSLVKRIKVFLFVLLKPKKILEPNSNSSHI